MILVGLIVTGFVSYAFIPILATVYEGQKKENYQKKLIPVGLGLGFVLVTVIPWLILATSHSLLYALTATLFALIGMVDDLLGNDKHRGFRGHLGALRRGKLTTGGLKAFGGFMIAIAISLQISGSMWSTIGRVLVIVLTANLLNLLDLRPGRAGKFFVINSFFILLFTASASNLLWSVAAMIGYLPWDLQGKVMMGDTGSNAFGAVLGLAIALSPVMFFRLISLITLIVLNISAEKISFSQVIENNRLLSFLDNWGRDNRL